MYYVAKGRRGLDQFEIYLPILPELGTALKSLVLYYEFLKPFTTYYVAKNGGEGVAVLAPSSGPKESKSASKSFVMYYVPKTGGGGYWQPN
jgi:hypothetical protein